MGKVLGRLLVFLMAMFILGCATAPIITPDTLKSNDSVRLVFKSGKSFRAFILEKDADKVKYVRENDHKTYVAEMDSVVRVERIPVVLDYSAYPISPAEIDRTKGSRNTWGYAIGGSVIGAATGLVVALPLWYAEVDGIPPFFVSGAGAVVGSIYFALRGQEKDRTEAITKIRAIREHERKLQKELENEKAQLQKLQQEKKKLKEQIEKKQETK
ncbi:MAG: hypothetical protein Kow0037_08350 [Calditrichia bacterium]